jgi:hypothetical protein
MALGKKITDNEKQLFVGLHKSGMGTPQIARITNRSESTIRRFTTGDEVIDDNPTFLMEEEMFLIFDNHAAGISNVDIAVKLNRPQQTVSKVVRREYVKHKNAYQRWLDMKKQTEALVDPVVPSVLAAIRAAREAGRTMTEQEESPVLVMEVQTVEAQKQDEPEQPGIDWQAKWCEAQQQIAELREINSILKGYVRHLQRLNEQ